MISVCIATFNGEKYIKEQIESIIPQLAENDEIIISDDKSSDNTVSVVKSLMSPFVHIFINEGEHGYTPNFENALKYAKGEYIFLCDQDDVWYPNKVRMCMELFKAYDFIISDADIIDGDGRKIGDSFYKERKSRAGLVNNIVRFSYLGCCMAFKREILHKAMPFPPNHKFCTHDNWLALVGMFFFRSVVVRDKLIHYRRHGGNVSSGGMKNTTSMLFKIRYRLYLIKWLILRLLK